MNGFHYSICPPASVITQVTTSNPINIENPINIVNPNINKNMNKALGGPMQHPLLGLLSSGGLLRKLLGRSGGMRAI